MGELRIKAWHAILIVVALLLFTIGATFAVIQWSQQLGVTPISYPSRYTADQVITVVQAYDPRFETSHIFVQYEGWGKWYVQVGLQTGYFYENFGRLEGIEYIPPQPPKPPKESGAREAPSWAK